MKRSFLLLTAIALVLLAGALAPVFKSDPGLVQIHFLNWTIETSVLVLILAVVLLWLTIQTAVWLWRMPAETARKVRDQRAMKQLEKGLLALTEGDWSTAEKALRKSASIEGKTTARYLAAAQAADGQDADERREYYLEQADSGGGKQKFLVELTRARMLLANGNRAAALPVLKQLHARRKRHPQVLELLARCHRELGHWTELQAMIPALRKAGVLTETQLEDMQTEIARRQLCACTDAEALKLAWKQLPGPMRKDVAVLEIFAQQAGQLGHAELAEPVLRTALKREWVPKLVLHYGDPGTTAVAPRLKQCEIWLQDHPQDAALHLALGRLCAGEELWGKARTHMIQSLELQATAFGYESLGQLLERRGELELAMACFRNALRMNQGRPPLALPGDQDLLAPPGAGEDNSETPISA
jgi:HemY protein